jgi:rfaE bifunctional protein kinase chain/domain
LKKERLLEVLAQFPGKRLLVLGDIVADEYIIGAPCRLSREAPIVVLEYVDRFVLPGGATNLAHNAKTLGADVTVCGVVGDDSMGRQLRDTLGDLGIDTRGVVVDATRPTTTKLRIWAGEARQQIRQQVARVDRVDRAQIKGPVRQALIDYLSRTIPVVDALLISDYENGVIGQKIIEASLPEARRLGKLVTVDSHGDLFRFKGATVATPNQPEAEATLQTRITDDESLRRAGRGLLEGLEAEAVLLTRGSQGMSLFVKDGTMEHLPVLDPMHVVDPTGAGDTVAATFTLAAISGATPVEAAQLSNLAAALVVRKLGAATTTRRELANAINDEG